MSHIYSYTKKVDLPELAKQIAGMPSLAGMTLETMDIHSDRDSDGSLAFQAIVDITFAEQLAAGQVEDLNNLVTNHIPVRELCEAIDAKTDALIAYGFDFGGNTFSLSMEAQSNWSGMMIARDFLTYPFNVSTVDGGEFSIPDQVTLIQFYMTGISYIATQIATGRYYRMQVMAAPSYEAACAVVDPR